MAYVLAVVSGDSLRFVDLGPQVVSAVPGGPLDHEVEVLHKFSAGEKLAKLGRYKFAFNFNRLNFCPFSGNAGESTLRSLEFLENLSFGKVLEFSAALSKFSQ